MYMIEELNSEVCLHYQAGYYDMELLTYIEASVDLLSYKIGSIRDYCKTVATTKQLRKVQTTQHQECPDMHEYICDVSLRPDILRCPTAEAEQRK